MSRTILKPVLQEDMEDIALKRMGAEKRNAAVTVALESEIEGHTVRVYVRVSGETRYVTTLASMIENDALRHMDNDRKAYHEKKRPKRAK